MEKGGETAAKRAMVCPTGAGEEGEDRLSALPDDVLLRIFHTLGSTEAAARTSVLSRRWCHLWALQPALSFFFGTRHDKVPAALAALDAAHAALGAARGDDDKATPPLHSLAVFVSRSSAESLQTWLPIAARCLAGDLNFIEIQRQNNNNEEGDGGAFELPCFERATSIFLELVRGFHSVALPPSGVFSQLTNFHLDGARLHGPSGLGEAVSSPRCLNLRRLCVISVEGIGNLAVHSESLLELELKECELQQLTVAAPALRKLTVFHCFSSASRPVADISAPQLVTLGWRDAYDPMSVQFGEISQLQWLGTSFFIVYGQPGLAQNLDCARLLQHFEAVQALNLVLAYTSSMQGMQDHNYLMEEMTRLPDIQFLTLFLLTTGHSFGASSFHVFRMCTGIRKLTLIFNNPMNMEVSPGQKYV